MGRKKEVRDTGGLATLLSLNEIFPHVEIENEVFYNNLKKSIQDNGILNPIVVCPITIAGWLQLRVWNPSILPPPEGYDLEDEVYQIRCGNNRFYISQELGWPTIKASVVPVPSGSNKYCKAQQVEQRKWIKENKYGIWKSN